MITDHSHLSYLVYIFRGVELDDCCACRCVAQNGFQTSHTQRNAGHIKARGFTRFRVHYLGLRTGSVPFSRDYTGRFISQHTGLHQYTGRRKIEVTKRSESSRRLLRTAELVLFFATVSRLAGLLNRITATAVPNERCFESISLRLSVAFVLGKLRYLGDECRST